MSDLQDRLQVAVGDTYRIEKELGGGGMSRVFLAEEVRLGRQVVIKVLPPEMAAGVSVDRFEREIQLAAKLQHPHVVPLLTAESQDDLLYYVMPFIEGESLRAKLAREGELPVDETLRILREVVDALSYAHQHGVVHRDIKPDNVMLTAHHAVVTDFGVAKAVSASSGGTHSSLTSLGVALGTPSYMSPEQAAADPHVDHRADIYAVGALAYEMLTGRPPFVKQTPQQILAAQVSETPVSVTAHRESVAPPLNDVVMRCLAKRAADRWQTADELRRQFEAMTTPQSGGVTPTGTQPIEVVDYAAAARQSHPVRVAGLFGLASVGALAAVYLVVQQLGLPDWVFSGAIALLLIGLPITLLTGHHERRRALTLATGVAVATPSGGVRRWLTWRRSLLGGALAFAGLGVVTTGYLAMRVLGIGPAATLVTSGVLEEHERIIIADFENSTADSTLGETVTELLRIDLAQSPMITVLEPAQVAEVLSRMERDPNAALSAAVAREVVEREGVKAYVVGEIRPVGEGYLVSARLVAAGTGDALVATREQASGSGEIVAAVDRVSAHIRERIGESLRTVRADQPLERVTTGSLEALRLYAQGSRIGSVEGDEERAIGLLEQAVGLDSNFAMAYRRMGAYLNNVGRGARGDSMLTRAHELRDRLSDRERYHVEALYALAVADDEEQAVTSYLALLEKYPNDRTALNNIAIAYAGLGRFSEAEEVERRSIANGGALARTYGNLVFHQANQGKLEAADTTWQLFAEAYPEHPGVLQRAAELASARWAYDEALEHLNALREAQAGNARWQSWAYSRLGSIAEVRGKLAEAQRWEEQRSRVNAERFGRSQESREIGDEANRLIRAVWFGTDPDVVSRIESLWQRTLEFRADSAPETRPNGPHVRLLARAGRPDRARQALEEYRSLLDDESAQDLEADLAIAEGRPLEAVPVYRERRAENQDCSWCWLWDLGNAYDRAQEADSAISYYERYLNTRWLNRLNWDARLLPMVLRRLGALYEEMGEREKAVEYYSRFVDLWKDADPELQPVVADVGARIVQLVGER